jgi:BolA protein
MTGQVAAIIRQKLESGLAPEQLDIIDESHRHAGHVGARPGGETHFHVSIVSRSFSGLNRVERQRMVYRLLADELKSDIHALALATLTPEEALPKE